MTTEATHAQALEVWQQPASRTEAALELVPNAMALANALADNRQVQFLPEAYRGKPGELLACILTAHELDIGPMEAVKSIYIVKGRTVLSANLMRALVMRAGHEVWLEETTATKAKVGGRRKGTDRASFSSYTIDEARTAGLATKDNWKNHPADMLIARATARLCRFLFADVLAGLTLTREEALDDDFADDEPDAFDPARPDDVDAPPPDVARTVTKPGTPAEPAAPAKRAPRKAAAPKAKAEPLRSPDVPLEGAAPAPADVELPSEAAEPAGKPKLQRMRERIIITANSLGLDDEQRHQLVLDSTAGRTQSTSDLTEDEASAVLSDLDGLESGLLRLVDGKLVGVDDHPPDDDVTEATLVGDCDRCGAVDVVLLDTDRCSACEDQSDAQLFDEPQTPEHPLEQLGAEEPEPVVDDPASWDADAWRAFLRSLNIKLPDAIREGRALAEAQGWPAPAKVGDLAHPDLAPLIHAWALAQGKS